MVEAIEEEEPMTNGAQLIKADNSKTVYLLTNRKKYGIDSEGLVAIPDLYSLSLYHNKKIVNTYVGVPTRCVYCNNIGNDNSFCRNGYWNNSLVI